MKLNRPKTERTPKQKATLGFVISLAGIAVGIAVLTPLHKNFGNAVAMIFALIAGIYYSRMTSKKKKD